MFRTGCLAILAFMATAHAAVPSVKVLIAKSLRNVVVEGMDLQKTIHTKRSSEQFSGKKTLSFRCNSGAVTRSRAPQQLLVASLSSPTGLISWGKNKYQGELQLLSTPGKDSCDLVNSIPMEAYIQTLLSKEMHGTWPVEALKAQAIAARTYAYERLQKSTLNRKSDLYHLESSEKDQVSGTFFDVTENTVRAASDTNGMILVGPSGRVSPAFFHSKCGGKTLRPDQVWGGMEEGYRSVTCTFCSKTGMKDWSKSLHPKKLTQMVDQALRKYYSDQVTDGDLRLMPDSLQNSEIRLYAGDRLHIVKKSYLRNMVSRELLPSNNFVMTQKNGNISVEGQGYGHGVGLCQLGALELAKRGYDYKQILSFYFPRHRIKTAY